MSDALTSNQESPATSPHRERAIKEGQRMARKVFSKRGDGNNAEAHLSELELAALLAIAVERGQFLERQWASDYEAMLQRAEGIRR